MILKGAVEGNICFFEGRIKKTYDHVVRHQSRADGKVRGSGSNTTSKEETDEGTK